MRVLIAIVQSIIVISLFRNFLNKLLKREFTFYFTASFLVIFIVSIGWLQQFAISKVLPSGGELGTILRYFFLVLIIFQLFHLKKSGSKLTNLGEYFQNNPLRTLTNKKILFETSTELLLPIIVAIFITIPLINTNLNIQPKFRVGSDSIGQLVSSRYFDENNGLDQLKQKIGNELPDSNPKNWFNKKLFLQTSTDQTIFSTSSLTTQIQGNWLIGSHRTSLAYLISTLKNFSWNLSPIEIQITFTAMCFVSFLLIILRNLKSRKVSNYIIFSIPVTLFMLNFNFLQVTQEAGFGLLIFLPFMAQTFVKYAFKASMNALTSVATLFLMVFFVYGEFILLILPLIIVVIAVSVERRIEGKVKLQIIFNSFAIICLLLAVTSDFWLNNFLKSIYSNRVKDLSFGGFSAVSKIPNFPDWVGLHNYIEPLGVFDRNQVNYNKQVFMISISWILVIILLVIIFNIRRSALIFYSSLIILYNVLVQISIDFQNPYPLWKYGFVGSIYLIFLYLLVDKNKLKTEEMSRVRRKVGRQSINQMGFSTFHIIFVIFLSANILRASYDWAMEFEKNSYTSPFYELPNRSIQEMIGRVHNKDLIFQGIRNPTILATFTDFYWSERGRNLGALPVGVPKPIQPREYLIESFVHQQDPRNNCYTLFGDADQTPKPQIVFGNSICITKMR